MTRINFYVLVDRTTDTVLSYPLELPENWNNIHGLGAYTDEELSDLEWAGHSNYAWIKFDTNFPTKYTFGEDWQVFAKEVIKEIYAKLRWETTTKKIEYNGIEIGTDDRTKTTFLLKKQSLSETPDATFSWKYNGAVYQFNLEDVTKILNAIDNYVQQCFEYEAKLIEKLDLVKKPRDLTKFNLELNWPSNTY